MKSLLKIPYILLVTAVCLIGILLLMTILPIPGNVRVKIVKSGSMEPAIPTGSIVVIKSDQIYFLGDVITFGADTKTQIPTTHRITKIEGKGSEQMFTTKGDANDAEDPTKTNISSVHGKVILRAPYVGYVLDFAKKPFGFALLVGVPALLIILDEIGKIWSELRRIKYEKRTGKSIDRPRSVDPLVVALIIAAPLLGYAGTPSTISYYRENENAMANVLMASSQYPEKLVLSQDTDTMQVHVLPENLISENMSDEIKDETTEETAEAMPAEGAVEESGEEVAESVTPAADAE